MHSDSNPSYQATSSTGVVPAPAPGIPATIETSRLASPTMATTSTPVQPRTIESQPTTVVLGNTTGATLSTVGPAPAPGEPATLQISRPVAVSRKLQNSDLLALEEAKKWGVTGKRRRG
jgi:hypothetical protein